MMSTAASDLDPTAEISAALRQMAVTTEKSSQRPTESPDTYRNASPVPAAAPLSKDRKPYLPHESVHQTSVEEVQLAKSLLREASTNVKQGIAPGAEPEQGPESYFYPGYAPHPHSHPHESFYRPGSRPDGEEGKSGITRSSSGTDFTSASTTPTANRLHPPSSFRTDPFPTPASDNTTNRATATSSSSSPAAPSRRAAPRQQQYYPMMPQYPTPYYVTSNVVNSAGMMTSNHGEPLSPTMSPPFGITSPIPMYGMPMGLPAGHTPVPPGLGHQQQPMDMSMPMSMAMPMGMGMGQYMGTPVSMFPQQLVPVCRYFQQGRCWAGQNCRFNHYNGPGPYIAAYPTTSGGTAFTAHPASPPPPPPAAVVPRLNSQGRVVRCRYFAQGKCWAGPHCRFSHE